MMLMQGVSQRTALIQDFEFRHSFVKSSANSAACYVCGKGLKEGYSVFAKTIQNETVLFCDVHYS